jgi:hypothetical protein
MKTFLNLSNGIELINDIKWDGFIRIQSSHLENSEWEEVLRQLDSNFLMWCSCGPVVVVDGGSSRGEISRACWQGIPWITYVLERVWFKRQKHTVLMMGKVNVTNQFEEQYRKLSKAVYRKIRYFRTYVCVPEVDIKIRGIKSTLDENQKIKRELWLNFLELNYFPAIKGSTEG